MPYNYNNSRGALETDERYDLTAQQPLTFVLVHGSWADAQFWDRVAAVLCSQGHTVYTPEYAGHGKDSDKEVTHAMITKSVVDFITKRNLRDFILVGHSFGGSVIQKVAEQVPDRIKRLVFWDAFVLNDGESVADEMPPQTRQGFEQLRAESKDDTIMLPFPIFRDLFVNTATLEEAIWLYARVIPEPAEPLFEKLDLKTFFGLPISKSYCVFFPRQCIAARRGLRLESAHVDTAWSVPPYCRRRGPLHGYSHKAGHGCVEALRGGTGLTIE
jgi:pimeloyl-ACP methyl ester carboxylesterase